MPLLNIYTAEKDATKSSLVDITKYYLISFDEFGNECRESDGKLRSDDLKKLVKDTSPPFTDIILMSHGWKGDVPAAMANYEDWIKAMRAVTTDWKRATCRAGGFRPLIIGLHWPSLPWGDEKTPTSGTLLLSAEPPPSLETEVDAYATKIANTENARRALSIIIENARQKEGFDHLPQNVLDAYTALLAESELETGDPSDCPGADQEEFDPQAIINHAKVTQPAIEKPPNLDLLGFKSVFNRVRDVILSPLRQLSFWQMKKRARIFGETSANKLLSDLQSTPSATRFHLMGHSFGCIVVSAMVAGAPKTNSQTTVHSVFLVQGALSLWSYSKNVLHGGGSSGYFHPIISQKLVKGPILVTTSHADTALGVFYPLAARVDWHRQLLGKNYPRFGAMGAFGIQGSGNSSRNLEMVSDTQHYDFEPGKVYNLRADRIIRRRSGLSGAHSDIAHREVAHAFWAAILAGPHGSRPKTSQSALSLGRRVELPGQAKSGAAHATSARGAGSRPARKRFIRAMFEGENEEFPILIPEYCYNLAIDIEVEINGSTIGVPFNEELAFAHGTEEIELTVLLESTDFMIPERKGTLQVRRQGNSLQKAFFSMWPKHKGASCLTATFLRHQNPIHQVEYTFDVGTDDPKQVTVKTKEVQGGLASMQIVTPRDMCIVLRGLPRGYDCLLVTSRFALNGHISIDKLELAAAVEAAREQMQEVLDHETNYQRVFTSCIDIPPEELDWALRKLAATGHSLFQALFNSGSTDQQTRMIGNYLRQELTDTNTTYKLNIVAEDAPIPWASLYVGDLRKLTWDHFIGMRHMIDQKTLNRTFAVEDLNINIKSTPELCVGLNVNTDLDTYVSPQVSWWTEKSESSGKVRVSVRTGRDEVLDALRDAGSGDQIIYFYCHATTHDLSFNYNPRASFLELGGDEEDLKKKTISIENLESEAPVTDHTLQGRPLVFLNACESSRMSAAFYTGFVPYFVRKGARGVIGTECPMSAAFAREWAERFFTLLLDGKPLGKILFDLRREFRFQHNNPLGLFYVIYCDGDTKIEPAPV